MKYHKVLTNLAIVFTMLSICGFGAVKAFSGDGYALATDINVQPNSTTVVKASPGIIGYLEVSNQNLTAYRYFKLYNKGSAATNGTDATLIGDWPLPPGTSRIIINLGSEGIVMSSGITYRASTAIASSDTGAPSANDVVMHMGWK